MHLGVCMFVIDHTKHYAGVYFGNELETYRFLEFLFTLNPIENFVFLLSFLNFGNQVKKGQSLIAPSNEQPRMQECINSC